MSNHTPAGTRRRLQALARLGWSTTALAARWGLPEICLAAARDAEIYVWGEDFAGRVARGYRDVLMRCPRGDDEPTRSHARAEGWAGPAAWDDPDTDDAPELPQPQKGRRYEQVVDPFAVEYALSSRDGRSLNRAERLVAARRLGMPNSPNSVISTKLGLSTTVAKSLRAALVEADRLATQPA